MSFASRAAASASSQRPLSMQAHSSTESTAPLAPRTPGARSWLSAARSTLTASSVSSRIQAAPPTVLGSQSGPPATRCRKGTVSARAPNGAVHALIHIRCSSARLAGQCSAGGTGSPGASRTSRAARTVAQASGSPVWWATAAAMPVASHARAGRLGDASAATEMSVSSASAFRFDHSSDQPIFSRAAMRRSGSDVSVRTLPASSRTQSACPAGRARAAAASSRRAWSSSRGLSSAARSRARAAAAVPPRRWAWAALSSSSEATCSSGSSAAAARCQAYRSGWSRRAVRDLQVRRGAFGERRGVVDGGPDERVGELRARRVQPDQARCFGRGEGAGGKPGYRRGGQVRAVGGRGEQQRGSRRGGQGGVPGGHDGGQPTGQRERLGRPAAPGARVGSDHLRQLDQRQRVPGRLGEHLFAGAAARRARLPVEEQAGVRQAQRRQQQPREIPLETSRRHVPARAGQQHEPLRFQAAGGEGERVKRGTVQPLRIVGGHQQRRVVRQPGKQGEHGDSGQQRVGRHGIFGKRESTAQRPGLPGRQAGHAVQHRAQ